MRAPVPLVSVIVPTHGRPRGLERCLAALAAQEYPRERYEVIVVDDAGDPPAADVVAGFREGGAVRLIEQAHGGPARARNRGAKAARGELLAFTDDDCRPEPGWLARIVAALERHPSAMVGGRVANALVHNRFAGASQLVTDIVYAHYNAQPERARFCASNNLALARSGFEEIGGFDDRFLILACEDRDLCDRWTHSGRPLLYAPQAVVGHAHEMGLAGYLRQHFTYGRGAAQFHRLRHERGSGRIRDEMGFHARAGTWLRGALRGRGRADGLATAGLLALWQAANAAGFAYESAARTGYRVERPTRPPSPAPGPPGPGGA